MTVRRRPRAKFTLSLPPKARARLQRLAELVERTETRLAEELIVAALERAERTMLKERLAASRTPERRARERVIAEALEGLRAR